MRFEQMKKTIFLVVLIAVAGLFSTAQARPVDEARVRLGQVEKTDHGKLNIKFISVVSDSRCAPNVQCIWAGNAKIKISVWKGRTRPQTMELNTATAPRVVTVGGYELKLLDLTPKSAGNRTMRRTPETVATISIVRR